MDMAKEASDSRGRYAREISPDGQDSLSKVARAIAPGSTVLDVGTGPGALGRYLSTAKGCTIDGIEMDAGYAAAARPSYRNFFALDLESARLDQVLPEAAYDAIVCADVLEHLRNPGEVLKRLERSLRPGGRMIISIPNVGYAGVIAGLLEGEFSYSSEGILDDTHVRFFTRNSLLRFLAEQGLRVLSLDFVTHTLEESEFRQQRLDRLPPPVQAALLSSPDALTYQFIVEATPGEPGAPIFAPLERPRALFSVQLYWRANEESYDGARSVVAAGEVGVDRQEIRLRLPRLDVPPRGLRLDVADRPGFLRLRTVALLRTDGSESWRWSGEDLSIAGTQSHQLVEFSSGPNRWWLSTGSDPWLELPVPAAALAGSSGCTLRVEMGWPMSADFFLAERVISQEVRAWSARSEKLEAELEDTRSRFARQLAEEGGRTAAALEVARRAEERATALGVRVEALEARGRHRRPMLIPADRVKRSPDGGWQWEGKGEGARFLVPREVGRSWYRVGWRGRSEVPLVLKLWVDYGDGFTEHQSLAFGTLDHQSRRQVRYVPIDGPARALRIDAGDCPARFDLALEGWRRWPGILVQLVALTRILRARGGWRSLWTAATGGGNVRVEWQALRRKALYGAVGALPKVQSPPAADERLPPGAVSRAEAAGAIAAFSRKPLVSVLVPCYQSDPRWLLEAVGSVRAQYYKEWELILVDDASTSPATRACLQQLERAGGNIRVLWQERNGGISAATNLALRSAKGEWVALLDHDDALTPDALFEVVKRLEESPDVDAVYTDQDKIDGEGRVYETFFKPDWSPELLNGVMYVGHLLVVRRELALQAGGFDSRFDKVQDFEFMLRVSERSSRIAHIPKILYHWRAIPGSVAAAPGAKSGITQLQAAAVSAHLARAGVPATARPHPSHEHRVVLQPLPAKASPLVSIVIPTRDAPHHIRRCLDSIFQKTTYPRFEVVVVDNGTTDEKALAAIREHPVRVVPFDRKFNFSLANNLGVEQARGEILVLLNNDTEVIDPDWLETITFYLLQPDVGMVGPLLLYPDGSVQHAGVVLGFRGTADHVMRGFPAEVDGYAGSLCCAREVSGVTAACLAIRRKDYLDLGGLVDHYATHYQDVDLCLRVRAQGKRILYLPGARLYHHESASRGKAYDHLDRALLLDSWGDVIRRGDPYYNPNFSLERVDYTPREVVGP